MIKAHKRTLFTLGIILILIALSSKSLAWADCPFGYEDEEYPGTCWRYIDTNNDGICDHSQSEPTIETNAENEEGNISSLNQETNTRFPILLIISFVFSFFLVLILKLFVKKGKITNSKEKIIFNILLLIFFIPSAITGMVLLLMTNMKILINLGPSFTQMHNISSLFFMWISGYHIIWHTKYYIKSVKNLVK